MAKRHQPNTFNLNSFCCFLFAFSSLTSLPFLYWAYLSSPCNVQNLILATQEHSPPHWSGHLPSLPSAWNHLSFTEDPPPKRLNIALFVKKWPRPDRAGGLERHALTLHLALAKRGHMTHVFTVALDSSPEKPPHPNIHFHLSDPSPSGVVNQAATWKDFQALNLIQPFDVIHTESVALIHYRARNLTNIAASWHGIAYETAHSDIVQDLVRGPGEPRTPELQARLEERAFKIIEEVKFFQSYAHHVATSDHAGDVLKRIYMLPEERVHVILNGVNEDVFKQDSDQGRAFRHKYEVPDSAALVLGMSGRLVKDKGHPIMFEALNQIFKENESFRKTVFVLVAGNGPWGARYKELGPNFRVLGPLEQTKIAHFYNALDIFVNPTLRAQGFDLTLAEVMLSGKPVMATRFASIMGSAIVSSEMGYAFSPTVASLKEALYKVFNDGSDVLQKKGEAARSRALKLFTATKMAAAYERLFLCISKHREDADFCKYPLPSDRDLISKQR
ncbi:uncharacterized protein LOC131252732 [Magnolia sinica]|uniref:uncharacterized protein LOC131252732 n=1 Tax=Magnolia sinica TaxID=86752 RepID=UPI00265ABC8A|nr:uncharacterized protein LOC131252732 [Magnolia sinica]